MNYKPITLLLNTAVGINENDENQFMVSPNPTSGNICIRPLNNNKLEAATISIADVCGKEIETRKINFNNLQSTIDLSTYAKGIYFLKIISGKDGKEGIMNKKIVIE